ncbi:MAG: nucleoside hydrolase [Rhodospirillales bacterium]|nr:nucleoside hydrolase [Rhodospirillales bacterium]
MGIWIDTDMGFDDLAAVLVLTHAGMPIDGMSLIAGNSPIEVVRANAASAANLFGWNFPIHTGREKAVMGGLETAEKILGPKGMLSSGKHLPESALTSESSAFDGLCKWLETPTKTGEKKHILALGPLGNIAALAVARPNLADAIDQVTWMGGAAGRGNHTPFAEYNAIADPEALAIVLAHNIPIRMLELDLCRKVLATPDDVDAIRTAGGKHSALLADLTAGYINIGISRGRSAMAIFDPVAAITVIDRDVVQFSDAHLTIDTSQNVTRGQTHIDPSAIAKFNVQYGVNVDTERARSIIFDALKAEAAK